MIPELNEIDLVYNNLIGNRTDVGFENPTAIIKHIPTGLVAECNYTRSWFHNRNIALGMLTQKVFDWSLI